MAIIDFYIRNQKLSKASPQIIGQTVNYIDCSFTFKTDDWNGLDKWLCIKKGNEVYNVNLVDDAIPSSAGLNLGTGEWTASVFGDGADGSRITTNSVVIKVEASDVEEGGELPVISLSEAEQIAAKSQQALDNAAEALLKANAVSEAAANGEFIGETGLTGPQGEAGYTPQKGIDYFDGRDGYTPVKGVDYFDGYTPVKGVDYFDGKDGYTPVKGIDYFDGVDGQDGYTPQKGVDYFDGYTPIKGVDYFDGVDGKDGSDGSDGSDGVSVTHSWNGTVLTVTSASGTSSADLKGADGTMNFEDLTEEQKESLKGADGYTPIKGVDYFDGYTPVKGVDYFDGDPGYTPQKGVDYFDGTDGKDGLTTSVNGVQQVNGNITLTAANVGALSNQGGTVSGNITIERTNYPGFALKNNTAGSMMTVSAADDGVAIFQNEKGTDYTTFYVRPPSEGIDNALQLGHSQGGAWAGAVVLHNKNFASHISAGAIGAETAGSVNAHNADANAHSTLFAGKSDRPSAVSGSAVVSFTVADNTDYTYTAVTSLTIAGSTGKAHGFVYFAASAPAVSVTGFTGTGGDDVAEAKASEVWEFSCDNGYILWKNWSA